MTHGEDYIDATSALFLTNLYVGIFAAEAQEQLDRANGAPGTMTPYASLTISGDGVQGHLHDFHIVMTRSAMARLAAHVLAWRDLLPVDVRDQFDAQMVDERAAWLKSMKDVL